MGIPDLSQNKNQPSGWDILITALQAQHDTSLAIARGIQQIAANTAKVEQHLYTLQISEEPGVWIVYCLACSEVEQRFVHPCKVHEQAISLGGHPDVPPPILRLVQAPPGSPSDT